MSPFNFISIVLIVISVIGGLSAKSFNKVIHDYGKKHPNINPNNAEYGDLWQGDINLKNHLIEPKMSPLNAIPERELRWTNNTVRYVISEEYDEQELMEIHAGIADLVNSTKVNGEYCIRILPRTTQQNYVDIVDGGGCSSYLGMIGGPQTMSLAPGCIKRHGTIMHEFLHALGFHHEHKRADRDDHVYINFDNIDAEKAYNFYKLEEDVSVDHLGTGYDYGSVMHYSAYAFAIDTSIPTIVPHDEDAEIGQREIVSALDIERVQIFYGCLDPENSRFFKKLAGTKWDKYRKH